MITRFLLSRQVLPRVFLTLVLLCSAFGLQTASAYHQVPQANGETIVTDEDQPVTIPVLDNDTGLDDTPLTLAITAGPDSGAAEPTAEDQVLYTPEEDFSGQDSFTYEVCDVDGDCSQAEVSITVQPVNDPPVAVDDSASTDVGVQVTIPVLDNDTDVDGDELSLSSYDVFSANLGVIIPDASGSLVYIPPPGFDGIDNFSYSASDGQFSDSATVTVAVGVQAEAPVANDDAYSTPKNSVLEVPAASGVLKNDVDTNSTGLSAVLVAAPSRGDLDLQADGSFEYTPDLNFSGQDTFTYQADDGEQLSNEATVTITVNEVNDAPVAVDDSFEIGQLEILSTNPPGVLDNDSDNNGDDLVSVLETGPDYGQLDLKADGSFEYTPQDGFVGQDSFTYHAGDGELESNPATVQINVLDQLDPEIAWVLPVENGKVYDVTIQMKKVILEVESSDNVEVVQAEFFRWDAVAGEFVDISQVEEQPFQAEIEVAELNPGWNQVYAVTQDAAGNRSSAAYIWLFRVSQVFLPLTLHQ